MPTKPNRAGQQQNYVPQGNGDASGEYADEATGSNIHFTNFKKPDEPQKEDGKSFKKFTKEEKAPVIDREASNKKFNETIAPRFESANANSVAEAVTKLQESLNDEGVEKYNAYLSENTSLKFQFGGAGRNAAGCAWGYSTIHTNSNAHTLRHEIGHTFDNFYGKDLPFDRDDHFVFHGNDRACNRFVDPETGRTMNEMLHEELDVHNVTVTSSWYGGVSARKTGRDSTEKKEASMKKIADVYNKYCDKIYDEVSGIQNARQKYLELYRGESDAWTQSGVIAEASPEGIAWKEAKRRLWDAQDRYNEEMHRQGKTSWYYGDSPEVQAARKARDEAEAKMEVVREATYRKLFPKESSDLKQELQRLQSEVSKRMSDVAGIVGDISDYLNVPSRTGYSVSGHGNRYFKDRYDGGFSMEIFANMFAAYSSKYPEARECVKEMFPKSSKIFEKIYNRQFD